MYAEIESSRASSAVVGNWAASVQQWMTPTHDDDRMDDGDEGGSGDIIARAKGMGWPPSPSQVRQDTNTPVRGLQRWASLQVPWRHSTKTC